MKSVVIDISIISHVELRPIPRMNPAGILINIGSLHNYEQPHKCYTVVRYLADLLDNRGVTRFNVV